MLSYYLFQEMSAAVVDGNGVTGHIISTTIGGKNGEPKQVGLHIYFFFFLFLIRFFPYKLCV